MQNLNAHLALLQAAQAHPHAKACKRAKPPRFTNMFVQIIKLLSLFKGLNYQEKIMSINSIVNLVKVPQIFRQNVEERGKFGQIDVMAIRYEDLT